ncbi:bifunctional DNA-formamidopyrimidine glycosylase/DNA-(apurinic or apyrimidinic site) lyase [Rhodospirillum centenum]|uniref:Formamidopyrimidine-DNA glycosylase n=1 Tax=Rhodospirillum centenum (strain ATCC 51521 / SW) TaxID=414684 RepID=FPG_RHOCS|nr:bifunctional DNA-formamidopyrimidine glycosylase/DNA-(apurinic or apyrimidinic site) lyase [Rhodospirillum centenum]B6IVU4.1 RecName: Full=Formamidopyrimidine-DNA glycosylase; Short=Fapy-DNA glycosylase; AltName: Full=DNA-(apurinic or apyrimidinic site) lyase MutM; Short=AP lyase MutM [Rhodospirillum centenum SW]ACJ00418.1 formamidopyrimidine-DNA glycosylase [Rhodospirillum centenum SW]
MPELPEVETVRRGLEMKIAGRVLVRVAQYRPDLRFPLPERFAARLTGLRVAGLFRRAKYLLIRLEGSAEGPLVWLVHLGMSGTLVVRRGPPGPPGPHDHLVFETDPPPGEAQGWVVTYNDVRRFGFMDLFPEALLDSHPMLACLGPEPLGNGFDAEELSRRLAGKITPIKAALLDQTVVAGLGNIYVCESLFRAGISPRRLAHTVAGRRAGRLVPAIRDVLTEAIAAGGSSLRDYVQSDGELGYFQHSFKVYGREGEPCPGCDCDPVRTGGIARIVQSGRSTFYCPRHQR